MRIGNSIRMVLVLTFLGLAVFPMYWMFVTSLTPLSAMFSGHPQVFPSFERLNVYKDAFFQTNLLVWLKNSLIVALGTTALSLALAILPAYALSRLSFRGKMAFGLALFLTQMLPEAMIIVPLYSIFTKLGLLNSLLGLVLANTAFTLPVVTWILKGAVDAIPFEIEEAARMDGASRLGIVAIIVVPLMAPTLAASAVIAFFNGWNEYLFALTFISDDQLRVASVGLASFVGQLSTPINTVMAVGSIYTVPAVLFYLFAQRYVVSGMTAGGVKG